MIKIGITGLIGSGKTTVSNFLSVLGFPIYNADKQAKSLINSNISILTNLKKRYTDNIYINNSLNKELLSQIIFNNEDERKFVNSIVHPIVISDFISWSEKQKNDLVFIESAILFEAKIDKILDKVIIVRADKEIILDRIITRDRISALDAIKKINIQENTNTMSSINASDILLINNNTNDSLILQTMDIIRCLRK